jgi:hypothetical protein
MSLINEDIQQMKLLINYNPKLTLTENKEVILEGGELGKLLQTMSKDTKVLLRAELEGLESVSKLVGDTKRFKNTDELLLSIQAGKTNANEILKDVLKNPSKFANKFPEIYKSASSNYAHQLMNSTSELAVKFKNATPADRKVLLQQSGYSKQAIENITQEVRAIEKTNLKSSIVNKGGKDASSELKAATTDAKDALKQESHIVKFKDKFKEYYNNGKGRISDLKKKDWVKKGFLKKRGGLGKPVRWIISKRKILAWAAVAGVTYWILKNWLSSQEIDEGDNNGGGDTGGGDTGGSGGGTVYTNCTTFPYKKGCQNSAISEVQDCLGLTPDGKFGPNTEAALVAKGYGTEITQDVYNKVKANCGGSTVSTTTTTTLNPADNYTLTDVDAENASSLFK